MEIEPLVPREKMFKAFQNIWAWKPSGHVANIFISSYLKVYIQNCVKEGQVVSSLSSEIRPLRQICQGQSMDIIYTHYAKLDVDATVRDQKYFHNIRISIDFNVFSCSQENLLCFCCPTHYYTFGVI